MSGHTKLMKWGVLLAAAIIVLRIALEQAGAPGSASFVFGVAWLYFLFPVLFAIQIRAQKDSHPFRSLLKNVVLFAFYTRVMVMITYMMAYAFKWSAPRFIYPGGNVGPNVDAMTGILLIPLRNILIWVVIATILGMIIGSITLLVKRANPAPSSVG
jgi:hypothetical protein